MAKTPKTQSVETSLQDAEDRRDAILRRMLNTPPLPKKSKGGSKDRKDAKDE